MKPHQLIQNYELLLQGGASKLIEAMDSLGPVPDDEKLKTDYIIRLADWPAAKINQLKADVKKIQTELKKYQSLEENLDIFIKQSMSTEGLCEIQGSEFKASISDSQGSLEIYDENLIAPEFYEMVPTINKKKIKATLDLGQEVPGARINQGFRLTKSTIKKG